MNWLKRFLCVTEEMSWKKRFYILSYAYLPWLLHKAIWKDRA